MLKIPVIANGSIDELNAASVLENTGADGLMIGRGAIGKPWIFSVLKGQGEPSAAQKKELILEHFALACEFYGKHGVAMMRKHLHEYSKGCAGAPVFRTKINAEGEAKKVFKLRREGHISIEVAANELGLSVEEYKNREDKFFS